jgi:CheY-like chemotaxis protein/anti-sigma regulatory factor (Ser/Thr protein kinase)/HPt (histidine-containing phosphotransfer) domain-containing protein
VLQTPVPDRIISDPSRLRQILLNLMGNAAKFTERGHVEVRVRVECSDGGKRLRVEVEDTGRGMTAEQATALFKPFTQADASVTRKHGGTGLGLTISRRLARMLGGDVRLEHSSPGKGSRFVLELPLIEVPGHRLVHDLTSGTLDAYPTGTEIAVKLSGRILLAEDGDDNRVLISFHLLNAGAEVAIAGNGRIALEMIERAIALGQPYDLLLSDMQMPEMDGYTLAKTLRANGDTISIVALTAHAMAEDRRKCLAAGCNDYATKPINRIELISTCAKWMSSNRDSNSNLVCTMAQPGPEDQRTGPLKSELADDPEMAPLVENFLGKMGLKIANLNEYLSGNRLDELARLAHQLKGSGGGYGFPTISEAARQVERFANGESDLAQIQIAVKELTMLCQQAIAGGTCADQAFTEPSTRKGQSCIPCLR